MSLGEIFCAPEMTAARREVEGQLENVETAGCFTEKTAEMYQYVIGTGMRFRPLLAYLGNFLVKGRGNSLTPLGAALELLHKASLVHDDLIDGDALRRGRCTFHRRYGNREAVLMGDLLVGAAFRQTALLRQFHGQEACLQVQEALAELAFTLSRGVLREIEQEGVFQDQNTIYQVMYEKTAIFLEKSLVLGGLLGGADAEKEAALKELGKNLGLVFQVVNDFNNVRSGEQQNRGRSGGDLVQQKATLLSYSLDRPEGLGGKDLLSDDEGLLRLARVYYLPLLEQCAASLERLPDSPWRQKLQDLESCVLELWSWDKGFTGDKEPAYALTRICPGG